jgi:Yip1 domain
MLLSLSETTVDRRAGLLNVIDVIVAPRSAFERLRIVPTWGWAFLVATLLGIAGSLLIQPAVLHGIDKSLPAQLAANPQIAKLPADQQAKAIERGISVTKVIVRAAWVFVPIGLLLVGVVQALALTIANATSRGDGNFGKFFAMSQTIAVIGTGLSSLILALIVVIKGADNFDSQSAVIATVPSLALLAPGVKGALAGFLGALNIFNVWATALLAIGATIVGKVKPAAAWAAAIVILLCTAAFMAYGAAQQG